MTTNEFKSELSSQEVIELLAQRRTSPDPIRYKHDKIAWCSGGLLVTACIPRCSPLSEVEEFVREMQSLMSVDTNGMATWETVNRAQLVKLPSGMQVSDVSITHIQKESKRNVYNDLI